MAAARKKQEEEHLKVLREIVSLPHNKHCFDCHQRGPTYVNMTIGSFVCTSCSGLLRGLNPPHRVKSISMASFSEDEIDFIKCRSNDFCRKVWLGLYDSRMSIELNTKDEGRMREAMSQRYDRKRWYVQPSETMYEEARRQNETASTMKSAPVKPLTLLVGSSLSSMSVQPDKPPPLPAAASKVQPLQRPAHNSSVQPILLSSLGSPASQPAAASPLSQQKSTTLDLFADFSGESSLPSKPQTQTNVQDADGFADFSSFTNQRISMPQPVSPNVHQKPNVSPVMLVQSSSVATVLSSSVTSSQVQQSSADKYSALADLESVFSATSLSSFSSPSASNGVNWDAVSRSSAGPVAWGTQAVRAPDSGSSGFAQFPGGAMSGYGSSPPLPAYAAVAAAAVSNPFGPTMAQQPVGIMSPYMAVNAPAGYGFYGSAPPVPQSAAIYGIPGTVYPVQNSMPMTYVEVGRPTSGHQVPQQQQQLQQLQQSQFGTWNQSAPVANPFMGVPAAPRNSTITNPFLS